MPCGGTCFNVDKTIMLSEVGLQLLGRIHLCKNTHACVNSNFQQIYVCQSGAVSDFNAITTKRVCKIVLLKYLT